MRDPTKSKEASKRAYYKRKAKGLCAYCGSKATHGVMCEEHRNIQIHQRKNLIVARREAGLCTRCGKVPPTDGTLRCEHCAKAQRNGILRYRYGLSDNDVTAIVLKQGGCGVCHRKTPDGSGSWCVDHDHVTDRVRGVLCSTCNTGLGKLGDSPVRLRAALEYLEQAVELYNERAHMDPRKE